MGDYNIPLVDLVFLAEISEFGTIELGSIISYNGPWNPKSAYDISNHETYHLSRCDFG